MWRRLRLEIRIEQRVHQGGLSQARLSDAHDVKDESLLDTLVHQLVGQRIEAHMTAQLSQEALHL